jgi:hypothetical protein
MHICCVQMCVKTSEKSAEYEHLWIVVVRQLFVGFYSFVLSSQMSVIYLLVLYVHSANLW